jgi:WD40 repeat protein
MTHTAPSALLRQWHLGEKTQGLCLNRNGRWSAASLRGGHVALALTEDAGEEPQIVRIDETSEIVSLIPDSDEHAFLALTEKGAIFIVEPQIVAPTQLIARDNIRAIASSPAGLHAFATDKTVYFIDACGEIEPDSYLSDSPIHDIALSPDGCYLAIASKQGMSVFSLREKTSQLFLKDKVCIALRGLGDALAGVCREGKITCWPEFKMPSVSFDVSSFQGTPHVSGITTGGSFLCASGARQAVLFPLKETETTKHLGGADRRLVSCMAPHASEPFVMVGYDDGMIVMTPIDGRVPIMIHPPTAPSGASVTGMVWNVRGDSLLATLESGWLMLFTKTSIGKAVCARLR